MTSQILYYANADENLALLEYAESIGLIPVPPLLDQEIDRKKPETGPFIYLSTVLLDQLHPYGSENNKISDATDPLLSWLRSYVEGNHLISGNLSWVDDVPEVAKHSKKHFGKLKRWVQNNFLHIGSGIYKSTGAEEMESLGMQLTSIPPSASVEFIQVPTE
jgi:hypothetical protein